MQTIKRTQLTVLILSDFTHVEGGGGKVAINEALLLAKAGIRVIFLAAVGPVDRRLVESSVEVICLNQRGLLDVSSRPGVAFQAIWNHSAFDRMKEILSQLDSQTTIVHLHGYTKALSTSPLAAAQRMGFHVICTLHDFFSACPNGAFFDYVKQVPCTRVALSMDCLTTRCDKRHPTHKLFRVARSVVQRTAGRFPSGINNYIVLSARSAEILRRYVPEDANFFRINNAIDVLRRPAVTVSKNNIILCVGRLDKEKGVTFLADVAASIGMHVVFVGEGPLRNELETRQNVTITGWLSAQEVVAWLDQARCLIFPSLWYETYGLVVDEAAARGVPSIVSDVTAAAERVLDGITGWHFQSGNAAALQDKLKITSDDVAISMAGQSAYQRFWNDLPTPDTHAEELIEIYRSVLGLKVPVYEA